MSGFLPPSSLQWLMSMLNGVDPVRQLSASSGESRMSWETTSSNLPPYASSSLHLLTHALPSLHTSVHLPPHMAHTHPSPCTHKFSERVLGTRLAHRHTCYIPSCMDHNNTYTGNNYCINRKSLIGLKYVQANRDAHTNRHLK